MIPSLSLSANSSSDATGGRINTGSDALNEGDWNTSSAPNSGAGSFNMNSKTMMYVAIAAAAYYFIVHKKAA